MGQPQGRARQQHLPGRFPRSRQHRDLRPQHAAARGLGPVPGRRHRVDGDVLPEPPRHGARARERRPRLRGRREQVLGALRLHRARDPAAGQPRARPLGREGRLLLRRDPPPRRPPGPDPRPVARGAAPPDRGRHRRFGPDQPLPELQAAHGVVLRASPGSDPRLRVHDAARQGRADPDVRRAARADEAGPRLHAGRVGISLALWNPVGFALSPRAPVRGHGPRPDLPPRLRARGVADEALRRQLELARSDLVSPELPARRVAQAVSPLLRRHVQGGMSDGIGNDDDAQGGLARARAAALENLPPRRERAPAGLRGLRDAPDGSSLARPTSSSTNTSTATPAPGSARAIRPDGPASSPSSSTSSATRTARPFAASPAAKARRIPRAGSATRGGRCR